MPSFSLSSFSLRVALLVLAAGLFAFPACTSKEFQTAGLTDDAQIEQEASQYWKRDGWWKLPESAEKVAITEFTVEFVTATGVENQGFGLIRMAQELGAGKRAYAYPESTKRDLPETLYGQYVAALEEAGFDVVPVGQVTATEGYQALKTRDEGERVKTSSSQGALVKQSVRQAGELYSAHGLVARDDGWFNAGGNQQNEVNAVGQAGADTGLRVRVKVGVDKQGRAALYPGSNTFVTSKVEPSKWVKDQDAYMAGMTGGMTSKQTLYFSEPIVSDKEFAAFKGDVYQVDGGQLASAVEEVFPTFARLNIAAMR